MDEETLDITPVKLVDRTGTAKFEKFFDGRPWIKAEGKTEWMLPRYVAEWLLKYDRDKVWTAEGEFVHRFTLAKDTDSALVDELVGRIGAEILEDAPVTLNTTIVEGWDTSQVDRPKGVTTLAISGAALREAQQAQRARQPAAPLTATKG